eukprot:Skav205776  [mRNA]  locus=scaffold1714:621620:624955:- [translate_table: standard]
MGYRIGGPWGSAEDPPVKKVEIDKSVKEVKDDRFTTTYSKNFGSAKPRTQLFVNAPSSIRMEPHATLTLRAAATRCAAPTPVNTLNTLTKSMSGTVGSLQIAGKTLTATLTSQTAEPSPSGERRHSLQHFTDPNWGTDITAAAM